MFELGDKHRGYAVERCARFGFAGLEHRQRIERLVGNNHRGPMADGAKIAHHHSEAVVEGHRNADAILGRVLTTRSNEVAVVQDVSVSERRALRETSSTRRVLQVDGVVTTQLR